jgi:hypothetical protein
VATKHLTLRVDQNSLRQLDDESRRQRVTRSELAKRFIDEGLRMEGHSGIVFRPGPAGRRPALADGPDVWVVARVFREMAGPFEQAVQHTAKLTELTPTQVGTAAKYYAEYRDEIDEWLRDLDDEAERAYAAWLREQDLLGR